MMEKIIDELNLLVYNDPAITNCIEYLQKRIWINQIKEKYNIELNPYGVRVTGEYFDIGYGMISTISISKFDEPIHGWNEQPHDTLLMKISSSSGAYELGNDYPKKIFDEYWKELKTHKYDYVDDINYDMYVRIENASDLYNCIKSIENKYISMYRNSSAELRIKQLEDEINSLRKEIKDE